MFLAMASIWKSALEYDVEKDAVQLPLFHHMGGTGPNKLSFFIEEISI